MIVMLSDINLKMVEAWRQAFAGVDVTIQHGSAIDAEPEALVSPANSFGFMDGSFDLAISKHFGWHLQARLQEIIRRKHDGELLVGQAERIETDDANTPYLITAPTMRVPMILEPTTVNPYLATRAALRLALKENLHSIGLAGMGTGAGQVEHAVSAKQMRKAFDDVMAPPAFPDRWETAQQFHQLLYTDIVRDIQYR